MKNSKYLNDFDINRMYFPDCGWNELRDIQLHCFADSSEKGYSACCYIRAKLPDDSYGVYLVCARGRVAPLKSLTLPRFELVAALLAARLIKFVKKTMHLDDCQLFCYTDSTVTLDWINCDTMKKDVFVGNRVKEIHSLTSKNQWYHCSGLDNPADLITRGVMCDKLIASKAWLHGPTWLSDELEIQPYKTDIVVESEKACLISSKFEPMINNQNSSYLLK